MDQIVTQGFGYLALLFVILSFQKNSRVKILILMLVGLVFFVIHYSLLGAWIGALMNLIEVSMVYVAYKKETHTWAQKKYWLVVFIVLFAIAGIFTAKSLIDYSPVVAQICATIAVWQTNPRAIRFIMLAPRPLWFIYNLVVGSYAGMVAEVLILLSVVTGIIRFDIRRKPESHK